MGFINMSIKMSSKKKSRIHSDAMLKNFFPKRKLNISHKQFPFSIFIHMLKHTCLKGEKVLLSLSDFIEALIPLYLMAIIGFFAQRSTIFSVHANGVITRLILYITLPALILFSLNTDFSTSFMNDFFWLTVM